MMTSGEDSLTQFCREYSLIGFLNLEYLLEFILRKISL